MPAVRIIEPNDFGLGRGRFAVALQGGQTTFTANFSVDENPISQGGAWHMSGINNTVVKTVSGVAQNTQTGAGTNGNAFDDGYALLTGFGPNVAAQATVSKIGFSTGGQTEFEFLCCATETSGITRAIEINCAHDGGYQQIIAWTGSPVNFVVLAASSVGTVTTGDVFSYTLSGSVIVVKYNGTQVNTTDLAVSLPANSLSYSNYNSASRTSGIAFYRSNTDTGVIGYSAFSSQVLP